MFGASMKKSKVLLLLTVLLGSMTASSASAAYCVAMVGDIKSGTLYFNNVLVRSSKVATSFATSECEKYSINKEDCVFLGWACNLYLSMARIRLASGEFRFFSAWNEDMQVSLRVVAERCSAAVREENLQLAPRQRCIADRFSLGVE